MRKNVFIACGVILVTAVLALAIADNNRPWRGLQAEFNALRSEQIRSRLATLSSRGIETLESQREAMIAEEAKLAERRDEIVQLEADLRQFRGKRRAAELRRDQARSELAATRWQLAASAEDAVGETALIALRETLRQTRMEIESLDEFLADRQTKLAAVRAELDALRLRWSATKEPIEELEGLLADLAPGRPWTRPWSSRIGVRQVSIEDGALPSPPGRSRDRVDRCVTCHLGVTATLEGDAVPAVFHSHPRQDLFLAAASPHPYKRFGCTVCHAGQGRATDFSRAGHTPRTAEQQATWASRWGWRRDEQRQPMLPVHLTEASCGQCHSATIAGAQALLSGRRLLARMGCIGCHSVDRAPAGNLHQPGPSLLAIAGKTRPAWVYRWLESPRGFRPATAMPHVFAEERGDASADDRRAAEISSIVHYLWEHSRSAVYAAPADGDVETGRQLFRTIGCAACHLVEPGVDPDGSAERRQGPNLGRIGSKVSPGWLNAWLLDPQTVQPGTSMPSLRLDEREAADLVAYLMTRRDSRWEGTVLPPVPVEVRDALVLSHLEQEHTLETSQARLGRMSDREKNIYLGERTIARYDCHVCHEIAGFTSGNVAPSRSSIRLRLRGAAPMDPRIREREASALRYRWSPADHRPSYRLSEAETEALTVAILGRDNPVSNGARASLARSATALESGRRVVERYGCRACHRIEGRGGAPGEISSPDQAPPDLTHAGARLRSPWLFSYLMDPGSVVLRPWLKTRMPSYALSEAEGNALVSYFAAASGRQLLVRVAPQRGPAAPGADSRFPPAVDLAVGKVVFDMLQCSSCHSGGSGNEVLSQPAMAPAYGLARHRLRSDWVVDWILDPRRWQPDTRMPATFLADGETEPDSSFLIGSISTPIFKVEQQRLLRLFETEADLHAYLADPERVAMALKDYLWTLQD